MKKNVTGTMDHKTNIYQDKRLQKTFYRDLNQKRLRTTGLIHTAHLQISRAPLAQCASVRSSV